MSQTIAKRRYKQSGTEALAADNVFHHLTYEGAVDVESITNAHERMALEAQINEFGQCPRVLFANPHPPRIALRSWQNVINHMGMFAMA